MALYKNSVGFHYQADLQVSLSPVFRYRQDIQFTYTFENFFHPYVGRLIEQLNRKSLPGLLDPNFHASLTQNFFTTFYTPLTGTTVKLNHFPKEIDVRDGGPYSNYNWELLFHIPLMIAVHLGKNQRFSEAQRWFHYIFDPTCNDTAIPTPQRYWRFLRFRQEPPSQQIDELLTLLSKPDAECTPPELELKGKILSGYEAIQSRPFKPHAVARTRVLAYQYSVVMKYLDNLIAWGDSLFVQDTIESINEATQRYVLAANLLGPRPQPLPSRGMVRPKTFAQLAAAGLDKMGNALVELEGQFPFNFAMPAAPGEEAAAQGGPLFGIGRTLYFCIPRNEKLLSYWDTVADRLFKIRHCMNIQGVVRQLALFDPPLDPGMLVKAAAAGIDIGSIVSGLAQPLSPVRSMPLIQKALELCSEVRALGNSLLSALEKRDGEQLSLLRQGHEIRIQQMSQEVRFLQWQQARESTVSLTRARASALERFRFYQRLLGLNPAEPDTLPLDRRELTEENFGESYSALVGQYERSVELLPHPQLKLSGGSPATESAANGIGNLFLESAENAELNEHLPRARDFRLAASVTDTIGTVLTFIPEFNVNLHFWGMGASSKVFGGSKLSDACKIAAEILRTVSTHEQDQAGIAGRTASYRRRADEWIHQSNLAARELMQNGRQLLGSLIAEQAAHREYRNVQAQIEQSQETERFLHEKFTNDQLYVWMQGEISRLYYQYYRFAFDIARKAERSMKHELMRQEMDATDYVQFNYWDGGRKGLLSGEALHLDVKRMEMAYHDNNKREFEITRHVSLRQLDPLALLTLRVTGKCEVTIPEWLYDRDCPGHYLRRLKTVALSLPCVVGPYTSVNCTLSLLRSSVRKSPLLKDDEYRRASEDDRFVDYFGAVQQVVTSSGTNDSGLFETNLRDDRPLPFEGSGAVSSWRLELPDEFRPFDYMSISDAILHIRYTAREGGDLLGGQALTEMREMFTEAATSNLALLFSLRNDFPTEWAAFAGSAADLALRLRKEYFPYMVQNERLVVNALEFYGRSGNRLVRRTIPVPVTMADELNDGDRFSDLAVAADGSVLRRDATAVFLLIRYSLE